MGRKCVLLRKLLEFYAYVDVEQKASFSPIKPVICHQIIHKIGVGLYGTGHPPTDTLEPVATVTTIYTRSLSHSLSCS